VPTLAAALDLAVRCRDALGARALEHVRGEHDLDRVAGLYARALEEAAGGAAVEDAFLLDLARAASDVGVEDVSELARRAREAGFAG
jgi:hypothetical protein